MVVKLQRNADDVMPGRLHDRRRNGAIDAAGHGDDNAAALLARGLWGLLRLVHCAFGNSAASGYKSCARTRNGGIERENRKNALLLQCAAPPAPGVGMGDRPLA